MIDFWQVHGWGFLICMFFFPRFTMLFATPWGGFLWWLGLILAPRITAAILAAMIYGQSNIVLVVFAWILCLSGESGEKQAINTQL